ncbi:MAG: hypothetical protein Kow0099_28150 [Candidatus Abyssubacteria bacterium]
MKLRVALRRFAFVGVLVVGMLGFGLSGNALAHSWHVGYHHGHHGRFSVGLRFNVPVYPRPYHVYPAPYPYGYYRAYPYPAPAPYPYPHRGYYYYGYGYRY